MAIHLQGNVSPELWIHISNSYEGGSYANAITDAILFLSDTIREKIDFDLDGEKLIGTAFGGPDPALRLNALQTTTEKSIQEGFQSILRGLYQAIRNPRSHEQVVDSIETANAIILFINYIITVINQASEALTFELWKAKICEPMFVKTDEYAILLAEMVPARKRYYWIAMLYKDRDRAFSKNVGAIFRALLRSRKTSGPEIDNLVKIISRDLQSLSTEDDIGEIFHILPPQLWPKVDKLTRLRTENRVALCIRDVYEGKKPKKGREMGHLALVALEFLPYFESKRLIFEEITNCLLGDLAAQQFVSGHFLDHFHIFVDSVPYDPSSKGLKSSAHLFGAGLSHTIISGNVDVNNKMVRFAWDRYPADWRASLADNLEPLREINPAIFFDYYEPYQSNRKPDRRIRVFPNDLRSSELDDFELEYLNDLANTNERFDDSNLNEDDLRSIFGSDPFSES